MSEAVTGEVIREAEDAETIIALVRAAMNREDDGLALGAIETLNLIDPDNLVGSPQIVRLLRRRVLRMWKGGSFVRVAADEAIFIRLVRALAINGRYHDDARSELEHLARHTSGPVQAIVEEALAAFDPPEDPQAKRAASAASEDGCEGSARAGPGDP